MCSGFGFRYTGSFGASSTYSFSRSTCRLGQGGEIQCRSNLVFLRRAERSCIWLKSVGISKALTFRFGVVQLYHTLILAATLCGS